MAEGIVDTAPLERTDPFHAIRETCPLLAQVGVAGKLTTGSIPSAGRSPKHS